MGNRLNSHLFNALVTTLLLIWKEKEKILYFRSILGHSHTVSNVGNM